MAEVEILEESIANGVRAGAVVSTMSQAVQERKCTTTTGIGWTSLLYHVCAVGFGQPYEYMTTEYLSRVRVARVLHQARSCKYCTLLS